MTSRASVWHRVRFLGIPPTREAIVRRPRGDFDVLPSAAQRAPRGFAVWYTALPPPAPTMRGLSSMVLAPFLPPFPRIDGSPFNTPCPPVAALRLATYFPSSRARF